MFPDRNTAPVTTDTVSFQFSVPYDTLANDPSTLALWEDDCISMQMGDGQYSVAWTNNVHQTLFMILSQRNYKDHAPVAEWTREGDMQEVRELYGKFSDAVQRVLAGVDQCDKWRIVDSVSGADWTSLSGKVILIGDAIHAMPPHAAQVRPTSHDNFLPLNCLGLCTRHRRRCCIEYSARWPYKERRSR